jgi:hypothetical protein
MPVRQHDLDWFAARLLPEVYDINQRLKYERNTKRLEALYHELAPMKFRITEPTFFWGKERQVGEIMDAPVGPYRNTVVGGQGLVRVPQFEEIMTDTTAAATAPDTGTIAAPPAGTFAQATASVLNPTPAAPKAKPAPLAARVRALTARKAKFQDLAAGLLSAGETAMATIENDGPGILQRANQATQDEVTAILDLDDAMKQFADTNGAPLAD